MRIACLQLAPEMGKIKENIQKADALLKDVERSTLDLLVLPEMAFTGYNFPSLDAIRPYLEPTAAGPSTHWAQETAQRLQCHVTIGYPETTTSTPVKHFNSSVTVAPDSSIAATYRKTQLYYTDETWASEGDGGFFAGELGKLGNVCMGICMDLSPYRFEAPFTAYEFATHCVDAGAPLVVMNMAWLTRLLPEDLAAQPTRPDLETLGYWIARFAPLVNARGMDEVVVVISNRCGVEPGTGVGNRDGGDGKAAACFAGTSSVFRIAEGRVELYDTMGRAEEAVMVVDTSKPPKFVLQQRSSEEDSE